MTKKKSRKLSKAQARAAAQRKKRQRRITLAVTGVVVVAVLVVFVLIVMGSNEGNEPVEIEPLRSDIETGVTQEGYPYRGSADAPVTLVEFSDYNCPHCSDFTLETAPRIDDELVATGQLRYVIQPYALWEGSLPIVEAAACALDQSGFWDFHHRAMANQHRFNTRQPPSRGMLREWAEAGGLDVDQFQDCLDEGRHRDEVLASTQRGKQEMGVSSTPTFFVNGVRVQLLQNEAPIDTIRRAIQSAQAGSTE